VFIVMVTWRRGRAILAERLRQDSVPLEAFLRSLSHDKVQRVPGTAVFLTAAREVTPHALLHSLKHYRALQQKVVFLTVEFRDVPWVPMEDRVVCEGLGGGFWRVRARYGFMNSPDVPQALELCRAQGLDIEPMEASFFLSRQTIVPARAPGGMATWRERLFAAMARNAGNAASYFSIPDNRVIELGTRVQI
jgi:KUP system potassium uptake protein